MQRLFRLLVVVAIVIIAVGFYRGWFALSRSRSEEGSNKVNVNLTMDGDKMRQDAEAVKKSSAELTDNVTDGENNSGDHPTGNVKASDR